MAIIDKRRKVLAVLAGGLVLGVGAAVTLAAWNDSEFGVGTFAAGSFVFQGSTDGIDFGDHATSGAAVALEFPFTSLSPDVVVYSPYALRVTGDHDGALDAVAPVGTGDFATGAKLSYDAVSTATFGCDEAAFDGGSPVPATITAGSTVNLCLKVTANSGVGGIEQGDTGTVIWQWNATSQ